MDQFFQILKDANPEAVSSLEADTTHRDITELLPRVVEDLETDQLTERASQKLTRLMGRSTRANRDLRDFMLSLRDNFQVCQERDPITHERIPELLRCVVEDEQNGHKYCYNILSLLEIIAQPHRNMFMNGLGLADLFSHNIEHRNPLTNVSLTTTQMQKVLTTAAKLYFLLEFLS